MGQVTSKKYIKKEKKKRLRILSRFDSDKDNKSSASVDKKIR